MKVIYHDRARQGDGYALLQKTMEQFQSEVAPVGRWVRAEWDQEDAGGKPLYTLKLHYGADEKDARFTPEDLKTTEKIPRRLRDLWADLLRERSHRLIAEMLKNAEWED